MSDLIKVIIVGLEGLYRNRLGEVLPKFGCSIVSSAGTTERIRERICWARANGVKFPMVDVVIIDGGVAQAEDMLLELLEIASVKIIEHSRRDRRLGDIFVPKNNNDCEKSIEALCEVIQEISKLKAASR